MASTTQDALYDSFKAVAEGLAAVSGAQGSVVQAVTTGSQGGGGGSVLSDVAKVFTSGLGLVPLFSSLFGLFGGGSEEPPPLVKYDMPERLYFEGANLGGAITAADYDQMGKPRVYGVEAGSSSVMGGGPAPAAAAPQINVNVQAMDSRSFLDHSSEIAQAVRQAMLNLSPINDVVSDL
jgi:hypothetical protein